MVHDTILRKSQKCPTLNYFDFHKRFATTRDNCPARVQTLRFHSPITKHVIAKQTKIISHHNTSHHVTLQQSPFDYYIHLYKLSAKLNPITQHTVTQNTYLRSGCASDHSQLVTSVCRELYPGNGESGQRRSACDLSLTNRQGTIYYLSCEILVKSHSVLPCICFHTVLCIAQPHLIFLWIVRFQEVL